MLHGYKIHQDKLGENAKLGLCFYLLDREGIVIKEDGFNENVKMLMASTSKVAIALLVLKRIYADNQFELKTKITINNNEFSPGPPSNTLDRYFFIPRTITLSKTVDELLSLMLSESDNTATDVLLNLVGGSSAVNDLMQELHIDGYNLSRSFKQLLADYSEVSVEKHFTNILKILYKSFSVYSMRPNEENFFLSERDTCTAKCMADLLKLIIQSQKGNSWLGKAARTICEKMEHCKTGPNMIKKGISQCDLPYDQFGHKTGGLGGIRNDAAFIHLKSGEWAILSIYTCQSPLLLKERDQIIADLTTSILKKHLPLLENKVQKHASLKRSNKRLCPRFCNIL